MELKDGQLLVRIEAKGPADEWKEGATNVANFFLEELAFYNNLPYQNIVFNRISESANTGRFHSVTLQEKMPVRDLPVEVSLTYGLSGAIEKGSSFQDPGQLSRNPEYLRARKYYLDSLSSNDPMFFHHKAIEVLKEYFRGKDKIAQILNFPKHDIDYVTRMANETGLDQRHAPKANDTIRNINPDEIAKSKEIVRKLLVEFERYLRSPGHG